MITIRLARSGAKKRPFYYIVVADKRSARDGRFVERLGYYNPVASGPEQLIQLDMVRIHYWHSCGAEISPRVQHIIETFKKAGASKAA